MLNRKDFMKGCAAALCGSSMCSDAEIKTAQDQGCSKELSGMQVRTETARLRFSKLIEIIEAEVPGDKRREIFHALGSKCADTYRTSLIDRYKGDIEAFLSEGRRNWMSEASYDKAQGTIRIVDRGPSCSCPMVQVGTTPPSFCDCTLGWQEKTYSEILGVPVKAELEESILRGGKNCIYRITVI